MSEDPAWRWRKPGRQLNWAAPWLLAGLAGVLQFAASPAVGWSYVVLFCLVPLHWALKDAAPVRAALLGWFSGVLVVGLGCAWLLSVLRAFSDGWALSLAVFAVTVVYQGARWGLTGALASLLSGRGWSPSASLALSYLVLEFWFPMLFPWYVGVCLHDAPLFLQVASLGGPWAVSAVVVATNLAVVEGFAAIRQRRLRVPAVLAFSAIFVAASLVFGAGHLRSSERSIAEAPPATIGLVQANDATHGHDPEALVTRLELTRGLLVAKPDLVVWSETSMPGGVSEQRAALELHRKVTRYSSVPLLLGAGVIRPNGSRLNSAFVSDASGNICLTCRYDKHVLFPLGEYVPRPVASWFPRSAGFSRGDRTEPLRVGRHRVLVSLCFEDLFPRWINRSTRADHHLLVSLVDDQWFSGTVAPEFHFTMSKLRAVEQGRFLVRGTNSGISGVVSPTGEVVVAMPEGQAATAVARIAWMDSKTVYRRVGDVPWWALSLVVAFGLVTGNRWAAPTTSQQKRARSSSETGPRGSGT